jgi:hypothetical protein
MEANGSFHPLDPHALVSGPMLSTRSFFPVLLVASFLASPVSAHPKMAEGFRDTKLGAKQSSFRKLTFTRDIEVLVTMGTKETCKLYVRPGEDLVYEGIVLEKIEYGFVDRVLNRILVHTKGLENFKQLASEAIKRYGTRDDPPETFEFSWQYEGKTYTKTLGIYHSATDHAETSELEHLWIWGVPHSGWMFNELSIVYNKKTEKVLLTVAIPYSD